MIFEFKEILKKFAFKYTNLGRPSYPYNIEPAQLSKLISLLDELDGIDGNFAEIGVARGQTTYFLSTHIESSNYIFNNKNFKYYAIDTFSSFVQDDINYEINKRGKTLRELKGFNYNSYEKWKENFKTFDFVKPIKSDCSIFDYERIAPLKLVFIDVDLYLPTKKALNKIYNNVVKGGYILIDDVHDNRNYDGAFQAYIEFCSEKGLKPLFVGNKCGIIKKE
tara:strand:- start:11 stop:676 length:666 start_codon:yes stop_codon:yes gene_type:complete